MRTARISRVTIAVMVVVGTTLGVTALAGANLWQLAKQLVAKDPGARVGGNTIVVTGNGERVLGVPDRPNFIVALGGGETISAGSKNSELGALGNHDTIVVGGGHELIVGGPDDEIIAKGTGHDLVVDTHPNATVWLESPDNEVIVSGRHDHVVCSGDAVGEKIHDTGSDTVSNSCLKAHNRVEQAALTLVRAARVARSPAAHAAAVTGDGSDLNPYGAPCDQTNPTGSCTVSFPARTLSGFWANEFVPAYECPGKQALPGYPGLVGFAWLVNHNYAPAGTSLPNGVEVQGLGPIGVTIGGTIRRPYGGTRESYASATTSDGSATNWTLGTASYRVVLHCTDDPHAGY